MKKVVGSIFKKAVSGLGMCLCLGMVTGCGSESQITKLESIQMGNAQESQSEESQQQTAPEKESSGIQQPVKENESGSTQQPVPDGVQPTEEQPTEKPSLTDEQAAQNAEVNKLAREAYKEALTKILNELKLPDGTALYYDGFYEFSQNRFAFADVDGDGVEELVFIYTTGPMAAMAEYVYGYDVESGELYLELLEFPGVEFYDNGVALAEKSHNHGRGDQLWPYAVYYYSAPTDDYRFGVNVDSWEKGYYGDSTQGTPFPTDADADGDGIVYYLMEYEDYSYENPVDGEAYLAWYEELLKGAELIKLDYQAMNQKNISSINREETAQEETTLPGKDEGSDWYVDRQGTTDVYSELQLAYLEEGVYKATIGLHRLTTLEGEARLEGEILFFEDAMMGVKGEISIQGSSAVFTVTESKFEYISPGEVFEFPEKL